MFDISKTQLVQRGRALAESFEAGYQHSDFAPPRMRGQSSRTWWPGLCADLREMGTARTTTADENLNCM